jgi:hypothetical protein
MDAEARIVERPHDPSSPECWCHPLALTPAGAFVRWEGASVAIDRIPPVMGFFLNHQDAIGAHVGAIPGAYIYVNRELCEGARLRFHFHGYDGDMRN